MAANDDRDAQARDPSDPASNQGSPNTQRRKVLRTIAAGGAGALAAPMLSLQAAQGPGRTVKIGFVSPQTGPIAAFGEADRFVLDGVRKAIGKGITIAGTEHPVQIISRDSQSNPNRAAEVTAQLIKNDRVDIVVASSTSDTVNPVADQCELNGMPCVTGDNPWQAYFFGRKGNPEKGFEWTYHFFWGFDTLTAVFVNMWNALPTNKVVGTLFSNDPDGIGANGAMPGDITKNGFKVVNTGLYTGTDDFSAQIAQFKKENVEIITGVLTPPAFATFWAQCGQQGLKPKIVTPAKAALFPSSIEALGPRGNGMTTEVWWSPHHPFKSGLTGQTAQQFCDAYSQATKKQWTQPIGFKHAILEVAIDVLKRAKKLDAPAIRDAIVETNYNSLVGPIQWKTGPVKNVCLTPLVGGQWKPGKRFKYDLHIVNNETAKNIAIDSKMEPLA
jgi:branched-chain amino acid transport system substrate-binding protein